MAWSREAGSPSLASDTNTAGGAVSTWNAGNLSTTPASGARVIMVATCSAIDTTGNPSGVASQVAVSSVTDTNGHTWYKDLSLQNHDTTDHYYEELTVWSAIADGNPFDAITLHFNQTLPATLASMAVAAGSYTGLSAATGDAAAVDVSTGQVQTSTSTPSSGSTSNTTAANELKVGAYSDAGLSVTVSAGTGYSIYVEVQSSANSDCALEDADSGSSGQAVSAAFTLGGSVGDCLAAVVVYKLAGGGGTQYNQSLYAKN